MVRQTPDTAARATLRNKRRISLWIVACFLIAAAVAGGVWFMQSPQPASIVTAQPAYEDLQTSVSTNGRVVPQHEFLARASFPGLIDGIDVRLGDKVATGQVLVRMRDPYATTRVASAVAGLQATEVSNENVQRGGSQEDRIGLQTDLTRAEAERTAAANSLATLKSLQDAGAASGAEVHAATQRLQAAEDTLRSVRDRMSKRYSTRDIASWSAKVAEARSSLASAKASLANTVIRSSIAGTVFLIPITANDFVSTGTELLRVADLSRLEVHANFDEADMGRLHVGAPVTLHWEGRPNRTWHGTVQHAPLAAVMAGARSVGECIITVDDAKDDLPPDTTVTVSVLADERKHVLTLPREALQVQGRESVVFRVAGGELVRVPVRVGLVNLDRFEVVAGLKPGDQVALHTLDNRELVEAMRVRIHP